MVDIGILIVGTVACTMLIGISAFFSSSEIAIFSLERHRIDGLVEGGDRRALVLQRLREDPHQLLVTVLVGNNVANIAVASIVTIILGTTVPPGEAVLGATALSSIAVLMFGEIAPKSYGVGHADRWALRVAKPIAISQTLMRPFVFGFELVTGAINRLTGGRSSFETYITRDDIAQLVESGTSAGVLAAAEGHMLRGVLDLNSLPVRAVMIPRASMPTVSLDAGIEAARRILLEERTFRVVVYGRDRDDIVGIADLRDIVAGEAAGQGLAEVLEDPVFVPETQAVDRALSELQAARARMGVVIDEFGSTVGVVTVEDIVEEVVGEIMDRDERHPIESIDERRLRVDGRVTVETLNDHLDLHLPTTGPYETVAGLLYAEAGRLLEAGDTVTVGEVTFRVLDVADKRITDLRVDLPPEDELDTV